MKKGLIAGLSLIIGFIGGTASSRLIFGKKVEEKSKKVDKFKNYYNVLNQWLINVHEGKKLDSYFTNNNYHKIAIYGMGELGNRTYEELKGTDIQVKYAIDKEAENSYSELNVVSLDEAMEEVDAVVVTAIFAYDEIKEELETIFDCQILSLEDVIYGL